MLNPGVRFEFYEQFKNFMKKYVVINRFDISWQKRGEMNDSKVCRRMYLEIVLRLIQNEKMFIIIRVGDPHTCN